MEKTLHKYWNYLCGNYRKQHTRTNYYNVVKRFLEYTHNRINNDTIQQWRIWANNHYKKKTALSSNINGINNFLKWYLPEKEYEHLRMKTVAPDECNEYSLSEEEYDKLIVESRQDIETALILELLNHLIRPSAIINIKLQHRNKDKLYIDDTETSGKTGSGYIVMSINLQELWDKYLLCRPIPLEQYKEYLLIDNEVKWRGYKYLTTLPIRNKISELGRRAGINKRVKPYTVKRTSITLRLDKDSKYFAGDPKIVQMMARHKKLSTTMKYDRRDENDIRKYLYNLNDKGEKNEQLLSDDKQYRLLVKKDSPQLTKNNEEDNSTWAFSFFFSLNGFFTSVFPTEIISLQWGKNWEKHIIPISQREMVSFLPTGENTEHYTFLPAVPTNSPSFFSVYNLSPFPPFSPSLFSPNISQLIPYISPQGDLTKNLTVENNNRVVSFSTIILSDNPTPLISGLFFQSDLLGGTQGGDLF